MEIFESLKDIVFETLNAFYAGWLLLRPSKTPLFIRRFDGFKKPA